MKFSMVVYKLLSIISCKLCINPLKFSHFIMKCYGSSFPWTHDYCIHADIVFTQRSQNVFFALQG